MKKRLLVLIASLLILAAVCGNAELITSSRYTVTFTPTIIQETVSEGYAEGDEVYSPTIRFVWAYRVNGE